MSEEVDAVVGAAAGAGQGEGEAREGRSAEVFVGGADVRCAGGREGRALGVGEEGGEVMVWRRRRE